MQSRSADDGAAPLALTEAATRVAAVARVHRNFYSSDTTSVVLAFLPAVRRFVGHGGVPVEVGGDEGMVPTTMIQPIGLLTNELVTTPPSTRRQVGRHLQGRRRCPRAQRPATRAKGFRPFEPANRRPGHEVVTFLPNSLGVAVSAPQAGRRGACFGSNSRAIDDRAETG